MYTDRPWANGRFRALGLTLLALLAFGAFAASAAEASPAWHLEGKTLAERGESQRNTLWAGGPMSFKLWGANVSCGLVWGPGYIAGKDEGAVTLNAESCKVTNNPNCYVNSLKEMSFEVGLTSGGSTGVIETLTPSGYDLGTLRFSGPLCALSEFEDLLIYHYGSMGAAVSQNGNDLKLAGLSSYFAHTSFGEEGVDVWLEGSISQQVSGGTKLEAW